MWSMEKAYKTFQFSAVGKLNAKCSRSVLAPEQTRAYGSRRETARQFSRIMYKVYLAVFLLLQTESRVFADTPVGDTVVSYNQRPDTQNGYHPANPGVAQDWNASPQQLVQRSENTYNDDYDGEQYEDKRIRLMFHPKKTITLNETNLRTWKFKTVFMPKKGPTAGTEPFLSFRRFTEEEVGDSYEEVISIKGNETQAFPGTNASNSTYNPFKQPMATTTQIIEDLLKDTRPIADPKPGETSTLGAKMSLRQESTTSGFAHTATSGNVSSITVGANGNSHEIPQKISETTQNMTVALGGDASRPVATNTETSIKDNTAYVDVEGDYDQELGPDQQDDVSDEIDPNSFVIILPGSKGHRANVTHNISSKPEIMTDGLLYMLSNLTASIVVNQRYGKKILNELREQKTQMNDVSTKIKNIYDILKKP